jgi:hypothetical protein
VTQRVRQSVEEPVPEIESTEQVLDRMIKNGAVALSHEMLSEFRRGYFIAIADLAGSLGFDKQADVASQLATFELNGTVFYRKWIILTDAEQVDE